MTDLNEILIINNCYYVSMNESIGTSKILVQNEERLKTNYDEYPVHTSPFPPLFKRLCDGDKSPILCLLMSINSAVDKKLNQPSRNKEIREKGRKAADSVRFAVS